MFTPTKQDGENWNDFQQRYGRQGSCSNLLKSMSSGTKKSSTGGPPKPGVGRSVSGGSLLLMAASIGMKDRGLARTNSSSSSQGAMVRSGSAKSLNLSSHNRRSPVSTGEINAAGKRRRPRKTESR